MHNGTLRIITLRNVRESFHRVMLCFVMFVVNLFLFIFLFVIFTVPNVSFHVYAPSFFARFFESHAVMLQGNAGLKPKEGEITSRPWQWPINYKVRKFVLNLLLLICQPRC